MTTDARDTALHPSRAILAYCGLVTILALACLVSPFGPGDGVEQLLGAILLAAAAMGLLVSAVAEGGRSLTMRLGWSGAAAAMGLALLLSSLVPAIGLKFVLAAFLFCQALMLMGFAFGARRLKADSYMPLATDGLVTLALTIFVLAAFPFEQRWVLGAVLGVSLLDYAAALSFREINAKEAKTLG
jgi:uncharacterized membrane protein HdeD (DUF308 family)